MMRPWPSQSQERNLNEQIDDHDAGLSRVVKTKGIRRHLPSIGFRTEDVPGGAHESVIGRNLSDNEREMS